MAMRRTWCNWIVAAGVCYVLITVANCEIINGTESTRTSEGSEEGGGGGGTSAESSDHSKPAHSYEDSAEDEYEEHESVRSCSPVTKKDVYVLKDNRFPYKDETLGTKFSLNYTGALVCADGAKLETGMVDASRQVTLTDNGHLGIRGCNDRVGKVVYSWYQSDEFCVERNETTRLAASVQYCLSVPSTEEPVHNMLKCCPPGHAVTRTGRRYRCVGLQAEEVDWSPKYYNPESVNRGRCLETSKKRVRTRLQTRVYRWDRDKFGCDVHEYKVRTTFPLENDRNETVTQLRKRWRILDNGSQVEYQLPMHGGLLWGTWTAVGDADAGGGDNVWCYDKFVRYSAEPNATVIEVSELAYHLNTLPNIHQHYECGPLVLKKASGNESDANCTDHSDYHDESERAGWVTDFYISMFIMALVPLTLTLIAYWLTWSSQNLHGWTVFSHILSVLLMNFFLGTAMLISKEAGDFKRGVKIFLGVSAHFFTIATFMWLTMINFDLWWTFRKLKSSQMDKGLDRFAAYSVLAWGVAITFVTVGLVLDSQYGDYGNDSDCDIRVPNYGRNFVLERSAEGIYLYFPLAVLMIMNCVFFFSTCTKIYSPKCKRKGMLHKQAGLDRQSVELFLKLFVVMGCTLTADAISWSILPDVKSPEEFPGVVIFIDAFNILGRAFLIFIIFACKPQVLAKLEKILRPGRSAGRSTVRRPSSSGKFSTQDTTDRGGDHSRIKMQVMA